MHDDRTLSMTSWEDKIRDGFLAAAVGYLCKHNATLSGAERGLAVSVVRC